MRTKGGWVHKLGGGGEGGERGNNTIGGSFSHAVPARGVTSERDNLFASEIRKRRRRERGELIMEYTLFRVCVCLLPSMIHHADTPKDISE